VWFLKNYFEPFSSFKAISKLQKFSNWTLKDVEGYVSGSNIRISEAGGASRLGPLVNG